MSEAAPIKTHIDAIDALNNINYDITALAHIAMFMGIGSKELQVEEQELCLLSDTLQNIVKKVQDVEKYLESQG
ncbi:hypothetical protein LS73_000140 [Helicobacter muridarum]|uniref:Uncharacterized protein n=1 Tax=Helicobacter muridarum TaxID=216 RepID=A0A099TUZ9_9HELI|nr:hypothetical protein [Helicobacter muridarum]TLE01592.1 hypothetical protein LS73_000140 [Helicobacter muridarum]STQ86206.1 Uncharacterised protein [Helicobacter muridarum]